MNPNTSTWPSGVMGMIKMMMKGMKVSRSRAVRLRADTSRGLRRPPSAALLNRRPGEGRQVVEERRWWLCGGQQWCTGQSTGHRAMTCDSGKCNSTRQPSGQPQILGMQNCCCVAHAPGGALATRCPVTTGTCTVKQHVLVCPSQPVASQSPYRYQQPCRQPVYSTELLGRALPLVPSPQTRTHLHCPRRRPAGAGPAAGSLCPPSACRCSP